MKIIDEKGRLFGKINVIDFLVILFLLLFTPMFYFGYKLFNKTIVVSELPKEFIEIELNCKFIKVKPDILKEITVGDKETDEKGATLSEIIWLGETEPYKYEFNLGSDEVLTKEDPILKEISVKLRLKTEMRDNNLYYKDNLIAINSPFDFKTKEYILQAIIPVRKKKADDLVKTFTDEIELNCKFIKVKPDILKEITVGDKETDEKGATLSEIIWLGETEPYKYEFNLGSDEVLTKEDPILKEISVKLRLKTEMRDNNLYYKDNLIAINSPFDFKTKEYILQAIIPVRKREQLKEKWMEVKVRFSSVIPELAKIISAGDAENEPEGRLVGRLKAIITNKPSEIQALSLEKNKLVTIPLTFEREIEAILNLLCVEKDGIFYFKNYPVKIGNIIIFATNLYTISGIVIGLEGS